LRFCDLPFSLKLYVNFSIMMFCSYKILSKITKLLLKFIFTTWLARNSNIKKKNHLKIAKLMLKFIFATWLARNKFLSNLDFWPFAIFSSIVGVTS